MSRIISLITISAAALASACAADGPPPSTYAWSYQQVPGDGEKLAYGTPNSDDVVLMMTCAPGSGRIILSALVDQVQDELVLASNDGEHRFPAIGGTSELAGGAIVEAEAPTGGPVLGAFAKTGQIALVTHGGRKSLAAQGADRDSVSRFFNACA